jgi:hypothetical protein
VGRGTPVVECENWGTVYMAPHRTLFPGASVLRFCRRARPRPRRAAVDSRARAARPPPAPPIPRPRPPRRLAESQPAISLDCPALRAYLRPPPGRARLDRRPIPLPRRLAAAPARAAPPARILLPAPRRRRDRAPALLRGGALSGSFLAGEFARLPRRAAFRYRRRAAAAPAAPPIPRPRPADHRG